VAAAIAAAVGVGEQPGRGIDESVLSALADRQALLVLDNCEQIRDGVAPFLERLLLACPKLRVLATSRARMMVPFEWVFPVPPLSWEGGADSDAVTLFLERAAAVGLPPEPAVRDRIAAICERLDGMALAIELAAARWPTLGLDGLTAGLSDQLRILAGGPRADDRHRSVRAALDWSHDLLEPPDRALLRRISVFVVPFTAEAATTVAGFGPLDAGVVADGLGRLAEQSLLTATPTVTGTRYQALETIRQYGTERLADVGELADTRSRHVDWCLAAATALTTAGGTDWRARFDALADDLRAALTWAADQSDQRPSAHRLALALAELTFTRTLLGESQQRYEQAAALAGGVSGEGGVDEATGVAGAAGPAGMGRETVEIVCAAGDVTGAVARAVALREAAGVAGCRRLGDDMFRLHRAAAEAARRAGDTAGAARDLAAAATVAYRFSSEFTLLPAVDEVTALLTAARRLSGAVDPASGVRADPSSDLRTGPRGCSSVAAGVHPVADAGGDTPSGVRADPASGVGADPWSDLRAGPRGCPSVAAGVHPVADAGGDTPSGVRSDPASGARTSLPTPPPASTDPSADLPTVLPADPPIALPTALPADPPADLADHPPADSAVATAAALALAEAAVVVDAFGAVQGDADNTAQETVRYAERAVDLARRAGDPVAESAALDALSGARTWVGDPFGAAAAARRRIDVLASVPHTPAGTHERMDALAMAAGTALGVGDLPQAHRWGRHLADHPLLAEVQHHAVSWLLVVDAFAGNATDVLTGSQRFLDAWRRSGRQRSFSLGPAAASVALVHGLRGDHDEREAWLAIVGEAGTASEHYHGYGAVFDAMVLLHHGDPDAALERVAPEPEQVWKWVSWIWLHWYAGLRAEASVLAGHPEARARVAAARTLVTGNPVATAQLDRAQALLDDDLPGQLAAATAFDAAGCPYQSARTLLLAGNGHTAAGSTALAALGLAPTSG
jgi:predicted ATPase